MLSIDNFVNMFPFFQEIWRFIQRQPFCLCKLVGLGCEFRKSIMKKYVEGRSLKTIVTLKFSAPEW
jgi:hypothetical protein